MTLHHSVKTNPLPAKQHRQSVDETFQPFPEVNTNVLRDTNKMYLRNRTIRWTNIAFTISLVSLIGCVLAQSEDVLYDGCEITEYYGDLLSPGTENLRGDVSRQELETLLERTHRKVLPYTDNDRDDVWKALIDLDSGDGADTVNLLYRQQEVQAHPHGTSDTWNREHLWPKSWGVGYAGPDFTDVHHLRPTDSNVNSARNNLYFGECGTVELFTSCRSPAHAEAASDTAADPAIFLPPKAIRGDVARAILYMDLRYSNQNNDGLDLTITDCPTQQPHEMAYKSALLEWHQYDPVEYAELRRNQRACERWQGNRNPFVDFPDLAEKLFGKPQSALGEGLGYPCDGNPLVPTPPTTMRSCKNLRAGDIMPIGLSSDSDMVAFVALRDLDGDLVLFLTDNAWTGSSLRTNEGTISLRIPLTGITSGTVFGYGGESNLLHQQDWVKVQGQFQLSTSGDTVLLYCQDDGGALNFLFGFDYSGDGWMKSNLNADFYGSARSALPDQLADNGSISLPHFDNYRYKGSTSTGSFSQLQALFSDPIQWEGSDDSITKPLPLIFSLPQLVPSVSPPLVPGDVMVVGMNSNDPDMVALVALRSLPGELSIYMTDNAWTGTKFRSNEGTLKLTFDASGLASGTVFGYGPGLLHGDDWVSVGGRFAIAEAGDTIILYTKDDNEQIRHLSAFSNVGGWNEAGLAEIEYRTDESALPVSLTSVGAISLPHQDNYAYIGPVQGDMGDIQHALQDQDNWNGSNSNPITPLSDPFLITSTAGRSWPNWTFFLIRAVSLFISCY